MIIKDFPSLFSIPLAPSSFALNCHFWCIQSSAVCFFSFALKCFELHPMVVEYSLKQLSPLIKACNPISPLLLSTLCFEFMASSWIFPHCPWSNLYLFQRATIVFVGAGNYICGCARQIRQFPREEEGQKSKAKQGKGTHTSHIRLIGMLGIANCVTNTK